MSGIQRYRVKHKGGRWLVKDPEGVAVRYADHEAALEERDKEWEARIDDLASKFLDVAYSEDASPIITTAFPLIAAQILSLAIKETDEDVTYEKPFREKVCPVPNFPGTSPDRAKEATANARTGQLKPLDLAPQTEGEDKAGGASPFLSMADEIASKTEGECPDCGGRGTTFAPRMDPKADQFTLCPTCNGTGKEEES